MSEPIEIKVTLSGQVDDALRRLNLGVADSNKTIAFYDDTTIGLPTPLPLLAAGIAVRLRCNSSGKGDSTIKLRPCRRSQLTRGWAEPYENHQVTLKIEQDWSGIRRKLAVSCVAEDPTPDLARIITTGGDPSPALREAQFAFLGECAALKVAVNGLTFLGPIAASRWKNVDLAPGGVVAERWTVGTLDFLELSIRADDVTAADASQAAFHRAVDDRGLPLDPDQESKTQQVLTYLAAAHRSANLVDQ